MKKYLSSLFIFTLVLTSGCSIDTKINNNISIKQASENIDKLIDLNYKQIQNNLGYPSSSIYYVSNEKIKNKDINSINIEDIKSSVSAVSSYYNKDNDTYLHLYFENGVVKDAITGNYSLAYSTDLTPNINPDYKLEFFNGQGVINSSNFSLIDSKNKFAGKNISEFNSYYKITNPNFIASTVDNKNKIYFYSLVDQGNKKDVVYPNYNKNSNSKLSNINPTNNNIGEYNKISNNNISDYSKTSLAVYTKDNQIEFIQIIDRDFMYELINKSFKIPLNIK